MEFIVPYQTGIRNSVASLGTALTEDQVRLMKRFAKTCVMVYDPDEAGEAASMRNLDVFIKEGLSVYIATLKKGYDPDSFIRNFGVESFNDAIKEAKNLFDYKLELLTSKFDPRSINGKVEIAQEILPTIAKIDNAILQSGLIKRLAQALILDEESLRLELKKVKLDYSHRPTMRKAPSGVADAALNGADKMLLALMLEEGVFIKRAKDILSIDEFRGRVMETVVTVLFEHDPEDRSMSASRLLNNFRENEEAGVFISEAASMNEVISDREKVFVDCVETIKKENVRFELAALQGAIREAHASKNDKVLKELLLKYNSLVKA